MKNPAELAAARQWGSLQKLRLEFWTKRLDHTLMHTQALSQLIYALDGALLTTLAVVIEKLRPSGWSALSLAAPVLFLALLHHYHAELIKHQGKWYGAIDERIRERLHEPKITFQGGPLGGTHEIHRKMHRALFGFLLIVAAALGGIAIGIVKL